MLCLNENRNFPFVTIVSFSFRFTPVNLPIRFALPPDFFLRQVFDVVASCDTFVRLLSSFWCNNFIYSFNLYICYFNDCKKDFYEREQAKRTPICGHGTRWVLMVLYQLGSFFNDFIRHGDNFLKWLCFGLYFQVFQVETSYVVRIVVEEVLS